MKFTIKAAETRSALDTFFLKLEEKIILYQQHIKTTTDFYTAELDKNLQPIIDQRESEKDEVEKKFQEYYEAWDGPEEYRQLVAEHESGRDSMYDYFEFQEDIWKEHYGEMFDYLNKSSLIIMYALLESQMSRLCTILKEMSGSKIKADDFKSTNYIEGYFKYLDLVILLDMQPLDDYRRRIVPIQYVRNRLAHNGGEFDMGVDENDDKELVKVVQESKGLLVLVHDQNDNKRYLKIFDTRYIDEGYELIRELFHDLFWMINKKFGFPVFCERMVRMFRPYFGENQVTILKIDSVKNGTKITTEIDFKVESGESVAFRCNITITTAKTYQLNILNQAEENKQIQECADEMMRHPTRVTHGYLSGIVRPNPALKVEMTFYPKD